MNTSEDRDKQVEADRLVIRKASYPTKLDHKEVAICAYSIYEKRGRVPGHDLDDWLEAEAQFLGAVAPEDDELEPLKNKSPGPQPKNRLHPASNEWTFVH